MTEISYTSKILNVGERTMDVEYDSQQYGKITIGVRRPLADEKLESVIAEYSPANLWLEQAAELAPITSGTVIKGSTTVSNEAAEFTPTKSLAEERKGMSISRLQLLYTLKVWGLYDQATSMVAELGDPIQLAFKNATEWRRTSPVISDLFSRLVLADGNPLSEVDVDAFFVEAAQFTL